MIKSKILRSVCCAEVGSVCAEFPLYKVKSFGLVYSKDYMPFELDTPAPNFSNQFGSSTSYFFLQHPIDSFNVARLNLLDAYQEQNWPEVDYWGSYYHNYNQNE